MDAKNQTYSDLCVCCGNPVPEGRMVCYACETGTKTLAPRKPVKRKKGFKEVFARAREKINEDRD